MPSVSSIKPTISVVVPVYNERGTLEQLYTEVGIQLAALARDHQFVFVDDGSTDGSSDVLRGLAARDPRVTVVQFRMNRGKADALNEGFRHATGEVVFQMDADLQDKPSEMPKMLEALGPVDMVSGWKRTRHDPLGKTLPSKFFNWVTAKVSGVALHDFNCGFKVYRREVLQEIDLYGEMHRFIPVIAARYGFKVAEQPVEHAPRVWGKSKYGFTRLFKGAYDLLTIMMITRFETRPMHFFGTAGLGLGILGFGILVYMSYLRLIEHAIIGNRPLLFLGIVLLLSGLQLGSAGLVGELLVRRTRGRDR